MSSPSPAKNIFQLLKEKFYEKVFGAFAEVQNYFSRHINYFLFYHNADAGL